MKRHRQRSPVLTPAFYERLGAYIRGFEAQENLYIRNILNRRHGAEWEDEWAKRRLTALRESLLHP